MGVIYKQQDPNDGRSVRIFLTPLGREKREISKQSVLTFNEAIREKVSAEKLTVFFEVINQINQTIETKTIFAKHETTY